MNLSTKFLVSKALKIISEPLLEFFVRFELLNKMEIDKLNRYFRNWPLLNVLLILGILTGCSPRISNFSSVAYNPDFSVFVNKGIGSVKRLCADYKPYSFSKINLNKTGLRKREVRQVFFCAMTHVTPTFAWVLFTYKKNIKTAISVDKVLSFNFPHNTYYIVKESRKVNGNQLYSLWLDLGNKKTRAKRLPFESLKNEIYGLYKLQQKCISFSNLAAYRDNNIYQQIAYFYLMHPLSDSLHFCTRFDKGAFQSIDRQFIALTKEDNDSLITNYKKIFKLISKYNIVLVKDRHSKPDEDIFLKQLVEIRPAFFKKVFLETLNKANSINQRGFPLTTSGFYFRNPTYRSLTQACLDRKLPLVSYDFINPKCHFNPVCNQVRDSMQAIDILAKTSPNEREVVFSGGDHSNLVCSPNYKYMGCFLCPKVHSNVVQIVVRKGIITIRNCDRVIGELKYRFIPKPTPIRYVIEKKRPCLIALYKKNEYEKYKEKAIPHYIFYILPHKKYRFPVSSGNYIEMEYNFYGNRLKEKELHIK